MATEAQIAAHRLNARKSTGPRTPEGKAVVSQNAVQHGLLAREGVLRGEDGEEWERHREMLLEELQPAGALEAILATRIVDLTWRLHRAGQDQNETFGALYDRHTAGAPDPAGPAERGAILGRMILEDFRQDAVLERLLRQERRIEGSLYRTLNELRRVHDQGRKADLEAANTLERWRDEDDRARKARAFALCHPPDSPSQPDGGTTNTPRLGVPHECDMPSLPHSSPAEDAPPAEKTCETNPVCAGVGIQGSGVSSLKPDPRPPTPELSCETNPICPEADARQVQCGTEVMSASAPSGLRKTNLIWESTGLEATPTSSRGVPPMNAQQIHLPADLAPAGVANAGGTHGRDGRATHGQDAHATETPDAGIPGVVAEEQSCETNPIGPEPEARQPQCGTAVRRDSAPGGLCQPNPICGFPRFEATKAVSSVPVSTYCDTGIPTASLSAETPAVVWNHGKDAHATHGRDSRATHGRDAHATELPDQGGTKTPVGQSCETNPIGRDPKEGQVLGEKGVSNDSTQNRLERTKPMCDRIGLEKSRPVNTSGAETQWLPRALRLPSHAFSFG